MAYEYEWDEIEIVVKEDYLKLKRKEQAFDEISNLIESNYVDYGENNLEDVEEIVNGYWEDE